MSAAGTGDGKALRVALLYAMLIALSAFFLAPFFWLVLTAVKPAGEVFSRVLPSEIRLVNFVEVLRQPTLPLARFFLNSTFLTVFCTGASLVSSSIVAFGFARLRFFGRDALFMVVLATMMIPAFVTMIPTFYLFRTLGWVDTFLPFMVPAMCGAAFNIFFLRQFFLTIPQDLFDSAKIDGCSNLRSCLWIAMPLAKPTLATLAIFGSLAVWNDFMGPLIYLHTVEKRTLALGLYNMVGMYNTEWHYLMAASLLSIIPIIILFFAFQRYFERGLVLSGLKG